MPKSVRASLRQSFIAWFIPLLVIIFVIILGIWLWPKEPPLPPIQYDYNQLVLDEPTATREQAHRWAKRHQATATFLDLAEIYWRLAPEYGVNPVVAYAQAGLETNYGKFGGVLDESYHNPCGMKTQVGGGDDEADAHTRFPDWETGIRAQLEHICLYAGKAGYPLENPIDPRHFPYLFGKAKTVGDIGQYWASADHYANSLAGLINRIEVEIKS